MLAEIQARRVGERWVVRDGGRQREKLEGQK